MGRDLTRRRHGRHRDFDRLRRGDDSLGFLSEQQARIDAGEGTEGIHDAMHLVQGEDESFTFEEVQQTSDPTDLGLTPAVTPPTYQGVGTAQSPIMLAAAPLESFVDGAGPQVTGVGNLWTIEVWVFFTAVLPVGNQTPFSLLPTAGNANDLAIGTNGGTGEISVVTRDSAASNLWFARYPQNSWTVDAWNMLTVTRTGSGTNQTFAYMNGSLLTPSNIDINNAGTMTDTARVIKTPPGNGHDWNGFMFATTMWDTPLTQPEILYRFANQSGLSASGWLDPTVDQGTYVSSASCLHWYPFALNPGNLGQDFATSPGGIDLTAANISGLSASVP